jgi:hypothetical protein
LLRTDVTDIKDQFYITEIETARCDGLSYALPIDHPEGPHTQCHPGSELRVDRGNKRKLVRLLRSRNGDSVSIRPESVKEIA